MATANRRIGGPGERVDAGLKVTGQARARAASKRPGSRWPAPDMVLRALYQVGEMTGQMIVEMLHLPYEIVTTRHRLSAARAAVRDQGHRRRRREGLSLSADLEGIERARRSASARSISAQRQ